MFQWWRDRKIRRWVANVEVWLEEFDPELAAHWRSCPAAPTTAEGMERRLWFLSQLRGVLNQAREDYRQKLLTKPKLIKEAAR